MLEGKLVPEVTVLTTSSISELDPHTCCPMRLVRFYSRFTDRKIEASGLSGAGITQLGSGGGGTYTGHWDPSSSHGLTQPFAARLLQAAPLPPATPARPQGLGCPHPPAFPSHLSLRQAGCIRLRSPEGGFGGLLAFS